MSTVIRKDIVAGEAVEFKFDTIKGYDFVVKNFSEGNVYVSYGKLPDSTDEMSCIPAFSWQRHLCQTGYITSIWVIADESMPDGVEVECLRERTVKQFDKGKAPNPIMRNQVADYIKVNGQYELMGVGFSSLDENPNAKSMSKTYISQTTGTTVVTSYQTEFPYAADMINSEEAVMALYKVGRNHLTGADAMFEYVRVDLFSPVSDQPNAFEARLFIVTNEVSNNAGEGGDPLTLSGTLKCVGDLVLGYFDTSERVFYAY